MGSISNTLASILSKSAANAAAQTATQQAQSLSSGNGFGDAVNVSLSPAAQAAVNNQGTPTVTGTAASNDNTAATPPSAPAAGGGAPPVTVSSSSTSTDTELLIEEAERQVIPQVGVTGASEVVDDKGNIDYVKLDHLLAQQTIPATPNTAA